MIPLQIEALLLVPFVLIGAGTFGLGVATLWLVYRVRMSGTDAVTDAVEGGRVTLDGTASQHEETIESPFFGRECLGYSYEVEKYSPDDDGSNWHTKDSGDVVVPFLLETDGGTAFVDTAGASFRITDDRERVTVDAGEDPPERIREFVETNESIDPAGGTTIDLKITEVHTGERRRYTEHVLLPGEESYVAGVGESPATAGVRVPREASAVIREPTTGGTLDRLKHRFWPHTFMIADSPSSEFGRGYVVLGAFLILFGLMFGGIPGMMFVSAL